MTPWLGRPRLGLAPTTAIVRTPSGPIDLQKMRSYRNNRLDEQWQLQPRGVSPGTERSREIQQQLNQPGLR
jgi:hypothetical protein